MKPDVIDSPDERTYVLSEGILSRIKKFEEDVNEFIRDDQRDLIIDLSMVAKLDSMSLAAMIRIKNKLDADGRNLKLINISEDILTVIELAGLESLL